MANINGTKDGVILLVILHVVGRVIEYCGITISGLPGTGINKDHIINLGLDPLQHFTLGFVVP